MTNPPMQKCDGISDTVINSTIAFLPGREYACTPDRYIEQDFIW